MISDDFKAALILEENRTFRWEDSIARPHILNNLLYTLRKKYADLVAELICNPFYYVTHKLKFDRTAIIIKMYYLPQLESSVCNLTLRASDYHK